MYPFTYTAGTIYLELCITSGPLICTSTFKSMFPALLHAMAMGLEGWDVLPFVLKSNFGVYGFGSSRTVELGIRRRV